jgi:hypothetical protein
VDRAAGPESSGCSCAGTGPPRLPLALSIAAARAAAGHGVTLAGLATELREARGRLDALEIPGAADAAGDAYRAAGDTDAARESWQQALAIPGDLRYSQASQVRARPRNLAKTS